ncbi:MAG TPA: 16S rRNA (guanine(527)-N(7))-methyltransferase RsmG [Myxococcota bacterium]|nr:16S rRNA (guanine(527)-N(7))-methyltransferase RsmG [Myxococcota bacterium]HRY92912.1 16S rRNA (guanine(527)-N(7))-methyltransferase RsmG [Myxococcota bacterium]HSA19869.1 16S rRNA (guanine(527)-N(7))-methyltransferase RsmG [Myxococcota bacterium]
MSSTFLELLLEGARRLGLDLDPEGLRRLASHREVLERWAGRVNLTTVRDLEGQVERLYLDSAVVLPHLAPGARLHDVGTGAGFPGLVLKALRPELRVTLTEARHKRVAFLRAALREMGLHEGEGLELRWSRVGWTEPCRAAEAWDEVISRAVAPPAQWVRAAAPLVAPGGRLWVMSGAPHADDGDGEQGGEGSAEPAGPPEGWALAPGFRLEQVLPYTLPFCGLARRLVAIRRAS